MLNRNFLVFGLFIAAYGATLNAGLTIAEKKAGLSKSGSDLNQETEQLLTQVNLQTKETEAKVHQLYAQVEELYLKNAPESSYKDLLNEINRLKKDLTEIQSQWQSKSIQTGMDEEPYALWHQPETTLEQLVIDYGSLDYVYLIPPEVANIQLSVASNLPVPRASWSEMLEVILTQNGVGVKQLNPYLRQLFLLSENRSGLQLITNKRNELEVLPVDSRICFVLTPDPADSRRIFYFLERFINPQSTLLQLLGRDILIIAQVGDIQDLLKLYDFAENNRSDKEYRMVALTRVKANEMAKILEAMFDRISDEVLESENKARGIVKDQARYPQPRPSSGSNSNSEMNGLRVMPLEHMAQALFLVGTREEVRKAEDIIRNVESQIGEAREKVVYWYTAKHSSAEELAVVLERVYNLMIQTGTGVDRKGQSCEDGPNNKQVQANINVPPPPPPGFKFPEELYKEDFYESGGFIVNPAPVQPGIPIPVDPNQNRENFIVDIKTGSIVMVVEADVLPKLKELLKKLDVPKKMVQIEVLLFEKRLISQNDFGMNLLRIGSEASNTHSSSVLFNSVEDHMPENRGVFQYLISRKMGCGIPAFDLSYKFLLSQDNIQINACPSVLTVNQTPASISIVEEISLNTGIFDVETAKGVTLKDAFTRAQYGITIQITPTIHMSDEDNEDVDDDGVSYITLDTDITFDTIQSRTQRPDVTRRHITNQARIPDGQSVILGGLRRKVTDDNKESIPFLGELPGIGKFFSISKMRDHSTEMFILITPKIVSEPVEDLCKLRAEQFSRRPGDIPEFLANLVEARRLEKCRLFEGTLTALFGHRRDTYYPTFDCECEGEFDGR